MSPARRLRILYLQRPAGGGSATGLSDMIASLDRDRYEPVVLCYHDNDWCDRFREAGAEVRVLDPDDVSGPGPVPEALEPVGRRLKASYGLRQVNRLVRRQWAESRRLAERFRELAPDLVHHNDNPRGDRASILAAWRAGLPQVCHVRFMPRYFRPVDWPVSRLPDRFLYVSRAVERHCRGALRIPDGRGRLLYDPFDFRAFRDRGRAQRRRTREELGLGADDLVVTNVGRIVPWKGFDVFIRAVAALATERPALRALVVGGGEDGAHLDELRELGRDLDVAERVRFTGFRDDVPEILTASDLVVHSATEPEPFGRVVVEAMATGRPVVATAAGGVPEIVEEGRTGLLVPPGDPGALAAAMARLADSPEEARRMGERAAAAVRRRFSVERFTRGLYEVYAELLGERAATAGAAAERTVTGRDAAEARVGANLSSGGGGETWA